MPLITYENIDGNCAVCNDGENYEDDDIVICSGCDLPVHQNCYGIPTIPEEDWFCDVCIHRRSSMAKVQCVLCIMEGGALKQADTGEWVHVACAQWIPETYVGGGKLMKPIMGLGDILVDRKKIKCWLCGQRNGACIQCGESKCTLGAHVTCLFKYGRILERLEAEDGYSLFFYCDRHKSQIDNGEVPPFHKKVQLTSNIYNCVPVHPASTVEAIRRRKTLEAKTLEKKKKIAAEYLTTIDEQKKRKQVVEQTVVLAPKIATACEVCAGGAARGLLLTCHKCEIMVHPDCYQLGMEDVTKSNLWTCDRCLFGRNPKVECTICFLPQGPMRRIEKTSSPSFCHSGWVHSTCAKAFPGLKIVLAPAGFIFLGLHTIHSMNLGQNCCLCTNSKGACLRCAYKDCMLYFHASCACNAGLEIQVLEINDESIVTCFCQLHQKSTKKQNQSLESIRTNFNAAVSEVKSPCLDAISHVTILNAKETEGVEILNHSDDEDTKGVESISEAHSFKQDMDVEPRREESERFGGIEFVHKFFQERKIPRKL